MGWKKYYEMTSEKFQELYALGEKWGNLDVKKVEIYGDGEVYYGAGFYINTDVSLTEGPKIPNYQPAFFFGRSKTRVKAKVIIILDPGASAEVCAFIAYYKNGEYSGTEGGGTHFGVCYLAENTSTSTVADVHEIEFVQESDKVAVYSDGSKVGEVTFNTPLTSFALALSQSNVAGGYVGILITDVVAEYYDFFEDFLVSMSGMMSQMMGFMLMMMVVGLLIRAFTRREKE